MSYSRRREREIEQTTRTGIRLLFGFISLAIISFFMAFMIFSFVQTGIFILSDTTINLFGNEISFNLNSFLFLSFVFFVVLAIVFVIGVAIQT